MTRHDRLGNVLCWAWIVLSLIAWLFLLFVGIDERCSRNETKWAREFGEMMSLKVSDND